MSKNVGVFVDVANLYYAAKSAGVDVDYVTLLKGALRGRDLIRAYAYSGLDPENENQRKFIDFLSKNGYKVVVKDIRKYGDGKIKANLDIELVVDLFRLADRMDVAVVISGDGDFAPALRALQDKGVRAEVISFRGNTSSDLIAVADEFIDIMKVVQVGRTKKDAVVPPEMPAKEVTPEFSFREAPPSVAAAARAALRTGARPSTRTPSRRGAPPAVLAVAVGSEAEQLAERGDVPFDEEELTATAGDPREAGTRRRRRRGGRGRGRSRGDTLRGEPGSDEFDALSEMDLISDREYAFSEADEETLAELGLLTDGAARSAPSPALETPDESAGTTDEGAEAPAPARRSRRGGRGRTRAADAAEQETPQDAPAEAGGAESAEGAEPAAATPRRRAPRRSAASSPDGDTGEGASRPRTSRRGRTASTDAGTPPAGEAPTPEPEPASASRPRRRSGARSTSEAGSGDSAPSQPGDRGAARPRQTRAQGSGSSSGDAREGESRSSAPADASDDAGGEPKGIWQRLLSGRKT